MNLKNTNSETINTSLEEKIMPNNLNSYVNNWTANIIFSLILHLITIHCMCIKEEIDKETET